MTCTHNCTHQPCPAPMACGVGSVKFPTFARDGDFLDATDFEGRKLIAAKPLPVIDESLLRRPLEARSQPDDMTYSGEFQGYGIPLYQANHDGSDPHEAPFGWLDRIREQAINGALVVAIWGVVAAIGITAGYFVAMFSGFSIR